MERLREEDGGREIGGGREGERRMERGREEDRKRETGGWIGIKQNARRKKE